MDLIGVNKMEKIFVAVDNERIELTGDDKKAFLAQRAIDLVSAAAKEAEAQAKAQAKTALLEKLGITEDEAKLLLS
jgi:hypothetical protein